jgi:hypothetical protein
VDEDGPIYSGYPRIPGTYAALMYQKGGYMMHNLRTMLPTDKEGKEVFFLNILKNTCDLCRGRPQGQQAATTLDFLWVAEQTIGRKNLQELYGRPDLDWWFDQWIRGWGRPKYVVKPTIENGKRGKESKVSIELVQEQLKDNMYRGPVQMFVYFKDGTREIKRWLTEAEESQSVSYTFEKPIEKVVMDEYGQIYADIRYVGRDIY